MAFFRVSGSNGGNPTNIAKTYITEGNFGYGSNRPTFTYTGLTIGKYYLVRIILASSLNSSEVSSSGFSVIGDFYIPSNQSNYDVNNQVWEKIIKPTNSTISVTLSDSSDSTKRYYIYELVFS